MNLKAELAALGDLGQKADCALIRLWVERHRLSRIKNRLIGEMADSADMRLVYQLEAILGQRSLGLNFATLINMFELCVSKEEKKVNGTVYTPEAVKQFIIENTIANLGPDVTILDPSCGCGSFLSTAALYLARRGVSFASVFERSLYGVDILPHNISRSKILLSLAALICGEDRREFKFNLAARDSLSVNPKDLFPTVKEFDAVLGNPPYVRGRNMSAGVRASLKRWPTSQIGIPDLYIPFFELGLSAARPGGYVGYISTNSYLHSLNGRKLRELFSSGKYTVKILNFEAEQLFEGVTSYTCVTVVQKEPADVLQYAEARMPKRNLRFAAVPYSRLDNKVGWSLASSGVMATLDKIRRAGPPLVSIYPIRNGIATLDNDLYVFKPTKETRRWVQRKVENETWWIEKAACRDIVKPNVIGNQNELSAGWEKVIFPYVSRGKRYELLDEKRFRTNFPGAYRFLAAHRNRLAKRDKGAGEYPKWYAYGRTQGFNTIGRKVLLPYLGKGSTAVACRDRNALLYCGYAVMVPNDLDMLFVERLLRSKVCWYFIRHTSKHYSGGYMSFAKSYSGQFPLPNVEDSVKSRILKLRGRQAERAIARLYGVTLAEIV